MNLIYCYDAYCGWCFGFSPVIKKIAAEYAHIFQTEVLSGGMILPNKPVHISSMANYIATAYQTVEAHTGIQFGEDYLWHIFNPHESDWFMNSEKPAIALCICKALYPDKQVAWAADLQYALHVEGRDLTDDDAYHHLLEKYSIAPDMFFEYLHSDLYKERAYEEFSICKQLQATGYPYVLLQTTDQKFYLVSKGYSDYDTIKKVIDSILSTI